MSIGDVVPLTEAELIAVQCLIDCDTTPSRIVSKRLLATIAARDAEIERLREQLRRSAKVCPKDGCMLWDGHTEAHHTAKELQLLIAAWAEYEGRMDDAL